MPGRLRQVCVVGAGLAGLACALAAVGSGLQVRVFDEAERLPGLPAHIEVVPNMLRDLARFGVADECVRAGFAFRGIDVVGRHGQHLYMLPTPPLAGPRLPAALGISHDQLHAILERAATERGVIVSRGVRVLEVQAHREPALVRFEGEQSIEADLVVLATGAASRLRMALFPRQPEAELAQPWWYALLPRPLNLDRPVIACGRPGHRAVLVPVRNDLAGIALSAPLPLVPGAPDVEQMRKVLSSFGPWLHSVAAQLAVGQPIAQRPVRAEVLHAPWHCGAVLAVGDCAHAFPPQFGQAAAQAIEDAAVLADLLPAAADRATLLEAYQRRRADRVQQVYDITRAAAGWDIKPEPETDLSLLMARLMQIVAQPA